MFFDGTIVVSGKVINNRPDFVEVAKKLFEKVKPNAADGRYIRSDRETTGREPINPHCRPPGGPRADGRS
jgi:hypothetical protein